MILRLIILWAIVYFGYRAIKTIMFGAITHQHRDHLQKPGNQNVIDVMIQDPVCGVYFPKKEGVRATNSKGQEIFFCSETCKKKFLENYT
ncbi:MAG: TRASH domain-containing protein [Candidatus Magnetoglobus multicellularis str. Araruama]|uniref:TRASH domain-containing protein n=1 Tax=Candidatus Magnetoglobus multicellularis str. Araruama TaxID=890399 RepID=A0A1V1P572_9BACT|nr:MAG: TRASH domain-containing protein [Candidatus Magnetoglobus multicellularis str. Araruama]